MTVKEEAEVLLKDVEDQLDHQYFGIISDPFPWFTKTRELLTRRRELRRTLGLIKERTNE